MFKVKILTLVAALFLCASLYNTLVLSNENCEGCDAKERYAPIYILSKEDISELNKISSTPGYLVFFYSSGCISCLRVKQDLLSLKREYPHLLIVSYNMLDPKVRFIRRIFDICYEVPMNKVQVVPALFVGSKAFIGEYNIEEALKTKDLINTICEKSKFRLSNIGSVLTENDKVLLKFLNYTKRPTILIAGLLDGINPCAFSTLIFFASFLLYSKKTKYEYHLVSSLFILGIFTTYTGIGLGLSKIFIWISSYISSKFLYILTGIMFLLLGVLNIYDFALIKKSGATNSILQLPISLKKTIHYIIHKQMRTSYIVIASFICGSIIASIEFYCTGQIYLPIIAYINSISGNMILYLLLYNIAFIIPLISISLPIYYTSNSQRISLLFKNNLAKVRFITGGLLCLLGIYYFIKLITII